MTPPETPDDAPPDASDQSYERVFADLFRRFWRAAPAGEAHRAASASPSADTPPEN